MPKIRVWLEGSIPRGAEDLIDVDGAEWSALTDAQRRARLNDEYDAFVQQFVSGGVEVIEEG